MENHGVVDVIHGLTVMVDNRNLFCALVKLGAFNDFLVMRINNDKQSVVVNSFKRFLNGNKNRRLVGKVIVKTIDDRLCKVLFKVNRHKYFLFGVHTADCSDHTCARTD